ncbi:peptidase M48 Ste24p [Ferroglobus placidus DSM 10642]|uniref:Peptidase M48 Ste24p n=1 Tax=Ferroglobus placidus (strain DSM 10642 / AEDII12DO) TaxID=589924 RepID=D3S0E0_FERPA|nr:M48 family metalloprotease [Ferroglobus placidus]ADC66203.1 peptidase M48 Ste24p [Ferroglobus placidus DSM 10642]
MNITSFLVTNLLFGILLMTLLFCISLILTYVGYLKKGKSLLTLLQFFIVLLVLSILTGVILSAISSNLLITVMAYFIFFLLITLLIWWEYSEFKCMNTEKISEINGIPIILCYDANKIYNAWFNPRKRDIHITKSLFEVLSEKEREAIIYHEIGHSKNKFWFVTTVIMRGLWLVLASFIIAITQLILFSNINISLKISLSLTFVAFLPMYAISFMISSWINEHEADVYATQMVGFKPTAMALVKLHIYNNLRGYESFLKNVEFSGNLLVEGVSYKALFREIIKSVIVYLNPQIIFNRPLPKTHPPLRLRLEKIVRFSNCLQ